MEELRWIRGLEKNTITFILQNAADLTMPDILKMHILLIKLIERKNSF